MLNSKQSSIQGFHASWIFYVTLLLFVVFAIAAFILLQRNFCSSLSQIVQTNQEAIDDIHRLLDPVKMSPDSCYYADEHLIASIQDFMSSSQAKLDLESSKIRSDYTILSLWAGVLMIVFLVFSIYSMFKTDELTRQSREGLKAAQDYEQKIVGIVNESKEKVKKELDSIHKDVECERETMKRESLEAINNLEQRINTLNSEFSTNVENTIKDFNDISKGIMDRFDNNSKRNQSLLQSLYTLLAAAAKEEESNSKQR